MQEVCMAVVDLCNATSCASYVRQSELFYEKLSKTSLIYDRDKAAEDQHQEVDAEEPEVVVQEGVQRRSARSTFSISLLMSRKA
jgi:hypothetical protein